MNVKTVSNPLFLIGISFLLSSCNKNESGIQFYYWKQNVELSAAQRQVLHEQESSKIYLKFFDIDLNSDQSDLVPKAKVSITTPLDSFEIVPCIYITNRSFEKETDLKDLAEKIQKLIESIRTTNQLQPFQEIQFDCDWTASTRYAYFQFLQAFKTLRPDLLTSSTLRLHQLKYPDKTGIPPADRVSLMCYNVGDIKSLDETNSIFKPSLIKNYITNKTSYPLEMDIALPVFSWTVVYRFEKLSLIINNTSEMELAENEQLTPKGNNLFQVSENHYFKGNYLYKDDLLRLEDVPIDSLKSILPLFKNLISKESSLILFELGNKHLENYNYEELQELSTYFY